MVRRSICSWKDAVFFFFLMLGKRISGLKQHHKNLGRWSETVHFVDAHQGGPGFFTCTHFKLENAMTDHWNCRVNSTWRKNHTNVYIIEQPIRASDHPRKTLDKINKLQRLIGATVITRYLKLIQWWLPKLFPSLWMRQEEKVEDSDEASMV